MSNEKDKKKPLKAKSSKIFDQIIVSTDNIEIAKIASKFGANVPFLRPKEISDDYSGIPVVINHVISFLKEQWGLSFFLNFKATSMTLNTNDNVMVSCSS